MPQPMPTAEEIAPAPATVPFSANLSRALDLARRSSSQLVRYADGSHDGDDIARGEQPPPDARALAVWTSEGEVLGRIRGDEVSAVEPGAVAVAPADFSHPLLGFRCCIDARLQSAFEPLPRDPQRVRTEVDDVPIVGR